MTNRQFALGKVINSQHGMGFPSAKSRLQLDDRITALTGETPLTPLGTGELLNEHVTAKERAEIRRLLEETDDE